MIIEYHDSWKYLGWIGKNDLTLCFSNEKGDIIRFSLTQEEKDKITLFQSGYKKGLREGGDTE